MPTGTAVCVAPVKEDSTERESEDDEHAEKRAHSTLHGARTRHGDHAAPTAPQPHGTHPAFAA